MRRLLLACVLVGCAEDSPPDAQSCTDIGGFEIAAPRGNFLYVPSMDVVVNETELWAELTLDMVDDAGARYAWTTDGSVPYQGTAGWWNTDTFHYELAFGQRYTVTVSHCHDVKSVTFFTGSP